jgi:hypothetical protein
MPYKTGGETHHGGVGNEKELVELMNACPELNINKHLQFGSETKPVWGHLGGTTQKADCDVVVDEKRYPISIKNHESSGSFDWINTSKLSEFNVELGQSVKAAVDSFKTENHGKDVTPALRDEVSTIFSNEFDRITSDQMKHLLTTLYVKYPGHVLVNDCKHNRLILYPKENNFSEFISYPDWEYFLKSTPRAKTSRMIFRRKDGVEINTNLRLRLVLNNGVGALLGKSDKNKCSIPCLKIQQDRVDKLLVGLVNTTIDTIPILNNSSITPGLDLLAEVCSQMPSL